MFYPIYLNENGDNQLKTPGQASRIDRQVFEGQAWEILSRLDYQHLHQDELRVEQTEAGTAASHRIARRPRFRAAGTERAACPRCFPKMYPRLEITACLWLPFQDGCRAPEGWKESLGDSLQPGAQHHPGTRPLPTLDPTGGWRRMPAGWEKAQHHPNSHSAGAGVVYGWKEL